MRRGSPRDAQSLLDIGQAPIRHILPSEQTGDGLAQSIHALEFRRRHAGSSLALQFFEQQKKLGGCLRFAAKAQLLISRHKLLRERGDLRAT